MCLSAVLFLGWQFTDKLTPPDSEQWSSVGSEEWAVRNSVCVQRSREREETNNILSAGKLSEQKDGERLRGCLQFANIQLFGRSRKRSLTLWQRQEDSRLEGEDGGYFSSRPFKAVIYGLETCHCLRQQ